ncbi:sulfite exporter TauE/SafE family protein [Streptomyces sp. NBC_01808]|uniref:sulfite exporter TauE/SafE family protein n=1 Tax=Streptomyces sp. NBC_01808 TaxID=2975947 RepID=UPI002DDA39A1|nr:sulfite exporter TauE/SafE family protein [Streptomyces sp. NBC_01808]WSA40973.1 sulfite exporter TauE/SafE family protein [Streptomyces sp. NBC_01808]
MDFSWSMVVAGAFVGCMVGLTGMGGGALMTPIMVTVFGVNPTQAIGSDLATSVFMKPFGAAVHQKAGTVRWDVVRWLLPTGVPAAFCGAFLLQFLGEGEDLQSRVKIVIGAALLLAVTGMLARMWLDRRRAAQGEETEDAHVPVRPVPTLVIGLVGGLVVGMTSVGSGSLIIVMLMLVHPRLKANHLVGTDLVQAIPIVAAAAAGHFIVGDASLGLAAVLLLGAIPGVLVGAVLSTRAPGAVLRWVLAIILLATGLSLVHVPETVIVPACAVLAAYAVISSRPRRPRPAAAPAGAPAVDGESTGEPTADGIERASAPRQV